MPDSLIASNLLSISTTIVSLLRGKFSKAIGNRSLVGVGMLSNKLPDRDNCLAVIFAIYFLNRLFMRDSILVE